MHQSFTWFLLLDHVNQHFIPSPLLMISKCKQLFTYCAIIDSSQPLGIVMSKEINCYKLSSLRLIFLVISIESNKLCKPYFTELFKLSLKLPAKLSSLCADSSYCLNDKVSFGTQLQYYSISSDFKQLSQTAILHLSFDSSSFCHAYDTSQIHRWSTAGL